MQKKTKPYPVTFGVRLANQVMMLLIRLGSAPRGQHLLSVKGRKSGKSYTTPVTLVEDGKRWLVAPFGEVNWVKNARAAGQVTLQRGRRTETVNVVEVGVQNRASVLKKYLALAPITQPYFTARPDSPLEDFQAEADRHPVFLLLPKYR